MTRYVNLDLYIIGSESGVSIRNPGVGLKKRKKGKSKRKQQQKFRGKHIFFRSFFIFLSSGKTVPNFEDAKIKNTYFRRADAF